MMIFKYFISDGPPRANENFEKADCCKVKETRFSRFYEEVEDNFSCENLSRYFKHSKDMKPGIIKSMILTFSP